MPGKATGQAQRPIIGHTLAQRLLVLLRIPGNPEK